MCRTSDKVSAAMGLDPDDVARRAFETAARTPNAWLGYADLDKRVADKLWPDDFLASRGLGELLIAMGHAGQAIEILLKGICITKRPEVVADGKLTRLKTHDVVKLAATADIVLDAQEVTLLNQLAAFVVWAGRYPLPLALGKTGFAVIRPEDKARIDRLYQRLFVALRDGTDRKPA